MEDPPNLLPSPANPATAAENGLARFVENIINLSAGFVFVIIIGIFILSVLRKFNVNLECLWKSCWSKSISSVKADVTPFVEVEEGNESILICYDHAWKRECENGVPRTVPMTRWTYEDLLTHLAASTKPYLNFNNISTQEHMEHVETILSSCTHFKEVFLTNYPSPMNAQIINLVKKKAIEMENSNISVSFEGEFDYGESASHIEVQSNGFCIRCEIIDPKRIAYSQFLDFLKKICNKNKMVCIELEGVEFKDLFVKLGWQYEDYMEENVTNGVASNVRLAKDTNIYCLEYSVHVYRSLDNAHNEADSDSGLSDL